MKLVKLQYMRDKYKFDSLVGAVAVIYDGGKLGIGISVKSPSDRFVKKTGRDLAFNRAKESLAKGRIIAYDLLLKHPVEHRPPYSHIPTLDIVKFSSQFNYEIEVTLSNILYDIRESLLEMFLSKELLENS